MMRASCTTVALISLALAASASAQANARVDSIFAAYDRRDSPGCAVGVQENGRTVFAKGYGMASLEHDVPITPSTPFYAASVSKQFTAFAVALLAKQGKLSLDDDVRKWLPEVPDFGKKITVRHLIHHTSGLRDYFGLLGMTGWPSDGPVTEAKFLDLVNRQKSLNFEPGSRHLYSNTGYVLLSILVKRVSGQSLREFANTAMFQPLGMANSQFRDDHTMLVKNRAFAYSARQGGGWQFSMPGFDVVGDGGLFTTVEDLLKWANNFDAPSVGDAAFVTQLLTRGRLNTGDSIPYAFGISHGMHRGLPVVEHGGAYGGYRTHLMRFPTQRVAVATLCNVNTANAAGLTQRVAAVFLGDRFTTVGPVAAGAPSSAPTVRLSREQLARFAGAYWDANTEDLIRLEVRDTVLAIVGGPALLIPTSETTFRNSNSANTATFVVERDGSTRMELTSASGRTTYRRMPPARSDTPLAQYVADYFSDELDTTWRIDIKDGRLVIRRRALPDIAVQPVFADAYSTPAGVLRFTRDASGRVNGFVVGAGRVTGFRFEARGGRL
jgi:CubicO group peptidase (beta-lactamase class C family)